MEIGERIKKRRKELQITQTQISEKTGISSGNLSGIESGKNLPSATALIGLSDMLNVSVDWLLKGDSSLLEILTPDEKTLLSEYRNLPPCEKDELLGIMTLKMQKINNQEKKTF
ncbi:MAG: helix-turn-helix domain-containing protein [Lachnospiraceae bacterium]|nr:helix-turn-helix domain-containing protein [Butyrivibrio sp.]MCM1343994.1 helix-turn-helix domain-containing protein [Muribaculaceae bacterium]MCM1411539.1 helix-turn-helix domain-containing protein [Lachnospiraceae bacterium]